MPGKKSKPKKAPVAQKSTPKPKSGGKKKK